MDAPTPRDPAPPSGTSAPGRGRQPGTINVRCCVCGRGLHRTPSKLREVAQATCGAECRAVLVARQRGARALNTHCEQCGKPLSHVDDRGRFHAAKRFCDHVCAGTWAAGNPQSRARWRQAMAKNAGDAACGRVFRTTTRGAFEGLVDDFAMPAEAFD